MILGKKNSNRLGQFSPTSHSHTFASLTGKPTTLSGYGITDAYTKSEGDSRYLRKDQDDTTAFNLTVENITQNGSVPAGVGSFGSQYLSGMLDTNFTGLADGETIVYDSATSKWLNAPLTTGTVSDWGDIGGTLSNQTDLQAALNSKQNTIAANTYEPYDLAIVKSDEAETITSDWIYSGNLKAAEGVYATGLVNPTFGGDAVDMSWNSIGYGSIRSRDWTGAAWKPLYFDASRYVFNTGNVSIGNTNNTYKLDVSGTGRFTGNVTVENITQNGSVPAGVGSFGSQYLSGMLDTNFTGLADGETIVYDSATSKWLNAPLTTGTVSDWGDIGGTLSNQTDLQAALNSKQNTIAANTYEPYDLAIVKSDEAETITSDWIYSGNLKAAEGVYATGLVNPTFGGDAVDMSWNSIGYGSIRSRDWTGAAWKPLYFDASRYVFNTGNVSIGNTNNTYKLDVSGTGRFTSTVTATNFIQS